MSVHVFDTMGTTVSIRFPAEPPAASVLDAVEQAFDVADRRYSLYRPDSELSRIARRECVLPEAGLDLRSCYADAIEWRRRTDGAFTPHRPDGVIDLSGIVKAQAVMAAGDVLVGSGASRWSLNAGGDILTAPAGGDDPRRLGIVDPADRHALVCTVGLTGARRALATSGTAERGEHIWRVSAPTTGTYWQVSVIADDIVTADVLATAVMAGGPDRCDDLLDRFDVDVLIVDLHGNLTATPGFRAALDRGRP